MRWRASPTRPSDSSPARRAPASRAASSAQDLGRDEERHARRGHAVHGTSHRNEVRPRYRDRSCRRPSGPTSADRRHRRRRSLAPGVWRHLPGRRALLALWCCRRSPGSRTSRRPADPKTVAASRCRRRRSSSDCRPPCRIRRGNRRDPPQGSRPTPGSRTCALASPQGETQNAVATTTRQHERRKSADGTMAQDRATVVPGPARAHTPLWADRSVCVIARTRAVGADTTARWISNPSERYCKKQGATAGD